MKMKKKLVRPIMLFMALFFLGLAGCSSYVSSFSATMMVSNNFNDSASLNFLKMKGTKVLHVKCKSDEGKLNYSGKIGKGRVTVYYDDNGTKKELFSLTEDGSTSSSVTVSKGKIYLIIETDGTCEDGVFSFKVE